MKVCIAEKPSVAKEIAYIIGAKTRKDGYFEGNGYAVTWTFGHLCTLKAPDDYQAAWKKWDFNTLPLLPEKFETKLITNKGVKKQFGIIKTLFKQAEVVINCGDAGQEGELIQRWVMSQAKYKGKVQRLWISSLTPEAIKDGFKNLKNASQYDNLFHAGYSRAIGDWLLGMNATRLYTLKYGGYKQVLSIGRVQTPTLAMLVKRHKEIENFVPKDFWELQTVYREVTFHSEKGRFYKKEEGEELLNLVQGKLFTVVDFTKKNGKEAPPRLFDLTGLQVHCNRKFGYSADQTLKLVQKLYEQKVVTYPRVDTTYLPNDVYPKVGGILKKLTNYSQLVMPLLGKTIRKSAKVFNDKKVTDHHAIIPTGVQINLPANEKNVYDAITRRFIAAFYPDCLVAHTTVIGEVEKIKFKATGKEILEEGWRVVFPKKKPTNNTAPTGTGNKAKQDDEKILPRFKVGETGEHVPNLIQKQTQPPKLYTEATLLRGMETAGKTVDDDELRDLMKGNGIGRPSTRANIIETLFRRNYTRRQKKNIVPTDTGIQLIDTIENELLKSPELTGQWEKKLREIADGEFGAGAFTANMKKMVSSLVDEVRLAGYKPRISSNKPQKIASKRPLKKKKTTKTDDAICPKCSRGKMLKGKSAYGCSEYKSGCSFRLPFKYLEKEIPALQVTRLLQQGSTIQLRGFKKDGKKVNGKLSFNDAYELVLAEKAPKASVAKKAIKKKAIDDIPCPKCKSGKVLRGKTAYGCSRWKEGCDFRFAFDEIRKKAGKKKMTKGLVLKIISGK